MINKILTAFGILTLTLSALPANALDSGVKKLTNKNIEILGDWF